MKYYAYIQNGKINGVGSVPQVTDGIQSILISKETYEDIKQGKKDEYIYKNGEIIQNPDFETIQAKIQNRARIDEIKIELENIDKLSQRASRAVALCIINNEPPNPDDIEKLQEFENRAEELREELQGIEKNGVD